MATKTPTRKPRMVAVEYEAYQQRHRETYVEMMIRIANQFWGVYAGYCNAIWNEETGELEFVLTERGKRRGPVLTRIV